MGSGESSLSLLLAVGWPSREYERDRGVSHSHTSVTRKRMCVCRIFIRMKGRKNGRENLCYPIVPVWCCGGAAYDGSVQMFLKPPPRPG
jgi:hypothetical protein